MSSLNTPSPSSDTTVLAAFYSFPNVWKAQQCVNFFIYFEGGCKQAAKYSVFWRSVVLG